MELITTVDLSRTHQFDILPSFSTVLHYLNFKGKKHKGIATRKFLEKYQQKNTWYG